LDIARYFYAWPELERYERHHQAALDRMAAGPAKPPNDPFRSGLGQLLARNGYQPSLYLDSVSTTGADLGIHLDMEGSTLNLHLAQVFPSICWIGKGGRECVLL
jgi:hypothetical protein